MDSFQPAIIAPQPYLPDYGPWNSLADTSVHDLLEAASLWLLDRGDQVDASLGIVVSGTLAVERELSDGRRVLASLFHEGDLVDLRRTERKRQGALIALKSSEFLHLDETRIDDRAATNPELAKAFIAQLADHFARMQDHATDLASKTPLERMASVLFEFKRWPETTPAERSRDIVRIPISRIDIADYIGVKPETVSRAIRELEREKLIGIPHQDQILLADIPSMRGIANGGRPRRSNGRSNGRG